MTNSFIILVFTLSFMSFADAKVSDLKMKEFSPLCVKMSVKKDKRDKICNCESRNFQWLLSNDDWGNFKKIYTSTEEGKIWPDELQPLDVVIYEVTTKCDKKITYTAPKVITLMKQPKQ